MSAQNGLWVRSKVNNQDTNCFSGSLKWSGSGSYIPASIFTANAILHAEEIRREKRERERETKTKRDREMKEKRRRRRRRRRGRGNVECEVTNNWTTMNFDSQLKFGLKTYAAWYGEKGISKGLLDWEL
jgi:hypothetical protein